MMELLLINEEKLVVNLLQPFGLDRSGFGYVSTWLIFKGNTI